MKLWVLVAVVSFLVAAGGSAFAEPPSLIEVRIQGKLRVAEGAVAKRAWSNRQVERSNAPPTLCFAPPNGNTLKPGIAQKRSPRRSTCAKTSAGRL